MPQERQSPRPLGPRRARRFVVGESEDHRVTEQIEKFLSGPPSNGWTPGPPRTERPGRDEAGLDSRTDFAAALRRETARTARYGRPATVVAVEFAAHGDIVPEVDRLARPIGYALRREARDTDRIARVAPTRFHVLLPETSGIEALRYIDRARHACEVWFTGTALPVRLRIEAASSGRDLSLIDALAAVEDRLSA